VSSTSAGWGAQGVHGRYPCPVDGAITDFAGLLRANGVRVSPAEVADAVEAGALVGVEDRATFRAALRATLAKRSADVPIFDALFEHFFSGAGRLVEGLERGILAALKEEGLLGGEELEVIARTLARLSPGLSPVLGAALTGDAARLSRLLREAVLRLDFSGSAPGAVGFHARRVLAAAGGAAVRGEGEGLAAALRAGGLGVEGLRLFSGRLEAALRRVEEAARRAAEERAEARTLRRRQQERREGLAPATAEEAERVEAAVRRLAERLKTRLRRRERAGRRGVLSVRRTLRRNLALGGFPARLVFRPRRPHRPELAVLCDVSESVRHATRLMLLFLYTLQSLFARVRTFVFVSDLAEVTDALRQERDPARAADRALASRAASLSQNTNTGRALATFRQDFAGAVTRRTTVLVIGDGRNNYHPAQALAVRELRRRARRVLWMCPEPRRLWGTGDSDMLLYEQACDRVAEVTTLADLDGIAESLLPR